MEIEFTAEPRPSKCRTLELRGITLSVPEGVYEPREDSFLLADAVEGHAFGNVLDMGTGCGLQGITAARKKNVESVVSVDVSEKALAAARANAEKNGVAAKMSFTKSDLFSALAGRFDTIAFNPPYLPTERLEKKFPDAAAWDGGPTGRRVIDRFLGGFPEFLAPKGVLLFLSSSLSGTGKTLKKLAENGFKTRAVREESFFFEKITAILAERKS